MSEPEGRGGAWTEERRRSDEGPPPQAAMPARRRQRRGNGEASGAPEASGKRGVAEPDPRAVQLPAVQHLVIRYAKRGKMRFASHRDVARAFERGVRRAGLPIAYSAGFTPHPKISYAGGAPTGVASEAEYLSIALTSGQDATYVGQRLNAALPDGIEVIDVTDHGSLGDLQAAHPAVAGGGSSLQASAASRWRVVLPGVEPAAAQRAVADFLALDEAPVERLTDKGVRRLDARAPVVELDVLDEHGRDGGQRAAVTGLDDCAILRMVVLHTAPAVRPDDVLTAFRDRYGLVPSSPPVITRLAQGPLALLAGEKVLWRRCCGAGEP
jgi:radical SAM-linked protein